MANVEGQPRLRLVLDENIPLAVTGWLRNRRPEWEVFHVLELGLRASTDFEIFEWAQENRCIIVTFDRDFADRRNFGAGPHRGIVRLRIRPTTIEQTRSALDRLFAQIDESDLEGAVVVVGRRNIRVRRPSRPDN